MHSLMKNGVAFLATTLVFAAVLVGISYSVHDGDINAGQIYSRIAVGAGIAGGTLLVTNLLSVTVTSLGYSVLCALGSTLTAAVAAAYFRADFPSIWMLLLTVAVVGGTGLLSGIAGSFAAAMVPAPKSAGFGAKLKQQQLKKK